MARIVKKHKLWLIPVCLLVTVGVLLCGWQLYAQGMMPPPSGGAASPIPPGMQGAGGVPADPGVAGTTSAAPAAIVPSEPTFELKSVLPTGVRVMSIKNWDGKIIQLLRFKYKLPDGRVITVHLPSIYKKEKNYTKAAWETCFQAYSMDREAVLDVVAAKKGGLNTSEYADQLLALYRSSTRESKHYAPLYMQNSPAAQIRGEVAGNEFVNGLAGMSSPVISTTGSADMGPDGSMNPAAEAMGVARTHLPGMGVQLPSIPMPSAGML